MSLSASLLCISGSYVLSFVSLYVILDKGLNHFCDKDRSPHYPILYGDEYVVS